MAELFYFEASCGCGIREGKDEDSVWKRISREVGSEHWVTEVRPATEKDIAWVRGMGGYIPKSAEISEG